MDAEHDDGHVDGALEAVVGRHPQRLRLELQEHLQPVARREINIGGMRREFTSNKSVSSFGLQNSIISYRVLYN
jgi:hypothetical protein